MKTSKKIAVILSLVYLPIGLYITFWILSQLNPDRLVWFLYWINVPVVIIITIISKMVEDGE